MTDSFPFVPTASEYRAALARWIPGGSDVAIFDVPLHRNIGDLFILAATRQLLADMGCRLVYAAGTHDYRTAAARRALTADTVLVGLGGGNFGDLYPKYQTLRERVVADFPDHRVVVLPQTIHFHDHRSCKRSAERVRRHPDLRVAARDPASLAIAEQFTPHTALMADVVDVIGSTVAAGGNHVAPAAPGRRLLTADGTLVLLRRDHERASTRGSQRGVDWLDVFPIFPARLALAAIRMSVAPARTSAELHDAWASLAASMLIDAVAIMRQASHVVTDRLHGAIVGRIAGRPVTLIDNNYGKLAAYHDSWWRNEPSIAIARRATR